MKKNILLITIIIALIMNGGKTPNVNDLKLYKEIERLKLMDVTIRFIDNVTVELKQEWSGFKRIKSLKKPDEAEIQAWIEKDSIPFLEIDPTLIDTNQFTGWYDYWATVPLSNGIGIPPLAGDIDHNGKMEVYGIYKDTLSYDFESHIYEVDTSGKVQYRTKYVPRRGAAMQFTDVDRNDRQEVVFFFGDSSYSYEQRNGLNLPTDPKFVFAKYQSAGATFTNEKIVEMDKDSLIDFIYRGSPLDSIFNGYMTFIAEFDPGLQNFKPVWSTILWPPNHEAAIGGYDVDDYDGDGQMNFLASGMNGQVWIGEATGNNQYAINWKDSLPGFINLLYQTSGDVDDDGKREFFVGATMGDGNWTVVYEADSNDHYSPTVLFHLLSGGSLDEPIYMTKDVDLDGKLELIIQSGGLLYIFKSSGDNFYQLYYFSKNYDGVGINFFDFNADGKLDIITSRIGVNASGMAYDYSDIYRCVKTTNDVEQPIFTIPTDMKLYQNYPNPFNPSTIIKYELSKRAIIDLSIYDIMGKKVVTLVHGEKQSGNYSIGWDGSGFSSGIYICRLSTNGRVYTNKMILNK